MMEHNLSNIKNLENIYSQKQKTIILAGARGDLGRRITSYLLKSGATVKALVRKGSNADSVAMLKKENYI